jgi:NhaA family Na+:H+ antiporter
VTTQTSDLGPTTALRLIRLLVRPFERFVRIEASSGIVLLGAALVALAWASSPWSGSYVALWDMPVASTKLTPHFVVNEVLMTLFFLLVGLEIRREIHDGELSSWRAAALPVFAAFGGMLAPAVVYLAIAGPTLPSGWGIPIATDIAFALGVVSLLSKRIPPALRVLLLALAIFDDIGAIVVIAVFYTSGVQVAGLALAAAGVVLIAILRRVGVTRALLYVPAGMLIWYGLYRAGVHPTLTGVIVGFMTPPSAVGEDPDLPSPAERLENLLHPWVAFGIMPLFALANAGVDLRTAGAGSLPIGLGIALGLVIGKPLGILAASVTAVKLRLASLPRDVTWSGIVVLGIVAGIGFTMSLFITGLAFKTQIHAHAMAKTAVLAGSALSAILALVVARAVYTKRPVVSERLEDNA